MAWKEAPEMLLVAPPSRRLSGGHPWPADPNADATCLLLERYVNGLAVFRRQRHFLILLAKLLLHKRKRVVAWRQAFNFVFTVRSRNREKRVLHHAHVHLHPRMLIALHRKHDFFAGEALLQRCRVWRL